MALCEIFGSLKEQNNTTRDKEYGCAVRWNRSQNVTSTATFGFSAPRDLLERLTEKQRDFERLITCRPAKATAKKERPLLSAAQLLERNKPGPPVTSARGFAPGTGAEIICAAR
jgi:hypothetical protein